AIHFANGVGSLSLSLSLSLSARLPRPIRGNGRIDLTGLGNLKKTTHSSRAAATLLLIVPSRPAAVHVDPGRKKKRVV
ncbi:hypothetical protein F4781DRAFT_398765, partial [Annulohypoxylon bovei var. microspora]